MCDEDGFARALARISVAQIVYAQAESLEAAGGGAGDKKGASKGRISAEGVSAQSAVVAAMADILGAYVQNAGARARARAEHAGRGAVGLRDVLFALERFGGTRVQTSTRDLATYARIERVAFPRAVPAFPAAGAPTCATVAAANDTASAQLPAGAEGWMPPLPAAHTYHATPGVTGGSATRRPGRADLAHQRRQVGASLARLQEDAAALGGVGGVGVGAPAGGDNPFLRPPSVGGGSVEERAETREPTEALPAPTMRESNRQPPRITEPDAKRVRIDRVLKDSGGVTGVSGAGTGAGGAGSAPTGGPGTPAMPLKDGIKGVVKAASDKAKTPNIKDGAKSKGNGPSKSKGGSGTSGATKSKGATGGSSSTASGGKPLSATAAAAMTATPLSASTKK